MIFRERPLKEILFGKKVKLTNKEEEILVWVSKNQEEFRSKGGRYGEFMKINIAHKGRGTVYLLPNIKHASTKQSILLFDKNVKIIPGPDLYVYLSPSEDVRQGLGEYLDLGLLKGTKGGQGYIINQSIEMLKKYKVVVVHCKQFDVLFTFAQLK